MERFTRRTFLQATTLAAAAATWRFGAAQATTKYVRHNVASAEGQRMLASYARGVEAMLRLPATHPHNWFRNAFVHLLDCPHGNWWFYPWHRGYVGYFERTIRALSGDAAFAMPYWDWTTAPQIPAGMFEGVLTPTAAAFAPFTGNLAKFTAFLKPACATYWDTLSTAQRAQLALRGYHTLADVWNDVTGFSPAADAGIAGNQSFATTCAARYLSPDNPQLDDNTVYDTSAFMILAGLMPVDFYHPENTLSFASSKTTAHQLAPNGATRFSILEGFPHNKVHNCIGGVGAVDPGPYGNMTNFLSPVDPVFFLHHANIDRLWDIWTRKQQRLNLPHLPVGEDLKTLAEERFLFYVDEQGKPLGERRAGDYFDTAAFDYSYVPGFGEVVVQPPPRALAAKKPPTLLRGTVQANVGALSVPREALQAQLSDARIAPLIAEVTLPRPDGFSTAREFDVLVNAPADVTSVAADSPYYAGTIAFFGAMMPGMQMGGDTTFAVPLPRTLRALSAAAAPGATALSLRLVPAHAAPGTAPPLKAVLLRVP